MDGEKSDPKKLIGSNYLLKFAEDVDTVVAAYSQYVTLELESSKPGEEVDMQAVNGYCDQIRTYLLRAWLSYRTLFEIINKNPSDEDKANKKDIDAIIISVKKNRIINSEEIETFIVAINKYLYSDPIKRLMDTAQTTMSSIYDLEKKHE